MDLTAVALRIRWYGKEDDLEGRAAFIERKTHREDWYGDGEASAKERFPMPTCDIVPFLSGALTPEGYRERLLSSKFKGDVEEAVQLATEVQALVKRKRAPAPPNARRACDRPPRL